MKKRRGDMHYMNRYGMLGNLYRVQRICMAPLDSANNACYITYRTKEMDYKDNKNFNK